MAPFHSFLLSLVLYASFVLAAPWIVTDFYEADSYTSTDRYYEEVYTTTDIEKITPTVTSMPEALSTITSVQTGYLYSEITIVQKLYPTGVGEQELYHYADRSSDSTLYAVNITYSAPTSCSTQWTTTLAVQVTPPALIADRLPTTAMGHSTSVDNGQPFRPTTYTYDIVFVDPTQLPSSSLSYYSRISRPTSRYVGPGCSYSYYGDDDDDGTDSSGGYHYYGGDYDYDNWFMDPYGAGMSISAFALTMILLFGWIGLWLILGFVEAWVRFRRLMTGWQTHRGLPVCWALTVMPLTLFFLCFCRRRGHRARTADEAAILREKWKEMSAWTRLRLFFAWGFRYKYPPMLGETPARVNVSKRPSKNPGPPVPMPYPQPVYQPQGPPAAGVPAGPSGNRAVGTDPEMGQVSTPGPHQASHSGDVPSAEEYGAVSPEASGALPSGQNENGVDRAQ